MSMNLLRLRRWLILPVAAFAGAALAVNPDAGSAPLEQPLTDLARQVLNRRMARHGADMAQLNGAVLMLRYAVIADASARIANEPRLVRPVVGGEDDLNASIPERFFVLQDQLREKAQRLATAARAKNDAQIAEAFGQLSATCVTCHSSYLPRKE